MRRFAFLLTFAFVVATGFAQSEITVSASAEATTQPDVAEFRLGIMYASSLRQMHSTFTWKDTMHFGKRYPDWWIRQNS